MKGVMRLGKKIKLSLDFIGPFEILERVVEVGCKLALPRNILAVHNVFHVSMLKKYVPYTSHVLEKEPNGLKMDLSYEELPVEILATRKRKN